MKIFVSWSGSLSQGVASVLREYLPLMIENLDVFVSKHDLESGIRWAPILAKELESTDFGILCLSGDSLRSDWLLFEAGALTKKMDGRACGLLIGGLKKTDVTGPLAQFQNRVFERSEVSALLVDINNKVERPREQKQLDKLFETFWPDIETAYKSALAACPPDTSPQEPRSDHDLLVEVLTIVRNIPQRSGARRILSTDEQVIAIWRRWKLSLLSKNDQSLYRRLVTVLELEDLSETTRLAEQYPEAFERMIAADLLRTDPSKQFALADVGPKL